jgi:hypothetical protein
LSERIGDSQSKQNGVDRTAASVSAAASGTLAGFAVTILTLVLTLFPNVSKIQNVFLLLEILAAAIVFLLVSVDFYLVAFWKKEVYERFGAYGSISYGLGASLLVVAVALMVVLVPFAIVASTFLMMMFLASAVHYILRWKYMEGELSYKWLRRIARIVMFTIIIVGIVLVYVI